MEDGREGKGGESAPVTFVALLFSFGDSEPYSRVHAPFLSLSLMHSKIRKNLFDRIKKGKSYFLVSESGCFSETRKDEGICM
jgi:hypothetical protein